MNRDQLLTAIKYYASLSAAQVSDALRRLFARAARSCDDANTYFIAISARYRR